MPDFSLHDALTPFLLNEAQVRGRVVRLSQVANIVLSRYDYPPYVARLLGQLLAVAAMLSSNLKQNGIFTIQLRGKGLVPLLVVDATHAGELRGFAEVSADAHAAITAMREPSLRALFGEDAYFTVTLDPGANMQRYQGVVALEGETIAAVLTQYFTHSQQVDVFFRLHAERQEQGWVVGGFMIERLPGESGSEAPASDPDEAWRYAAAIAATIEPAELTDALLDAPALLYRLYHEEGVWVHDARPLTTGCRCSRERILSILLSMAATDRADMVVDGMASVHCQFCNRTERFTPEELGLSVN